MVTNNALEIIMDRKLIAFTFDDVPSYRENDGNPTTTIIDTLTEFGGRGTMFVIGRYLNANGRKLVDISLEHGFELGNHTQEHKDFWDLTREETEEDIMTLQNTVLRDFGIKLKYLRPGGLSINKHAYDIARENDMAVIFGSYGNAYLQDWDPNTTSEYIKKTCLENAYSGQIVLMHGYSKGTQGCFREICETLARDGYEFVTLTELFNAFGVKELPHDRPLVDAQLTVVE